MSEYDWFVAWWRDQWRPRWEKVPSEEIFRSTSDYARWINAGNPGFTGTPQGFESTIRGEQAPVRGRAGAGRGGRGGFGTFGQQDFPTLVGFPELPGDIERAFTPGAGRLQQGTPLLPAPAGPIAPVTGAPADTPPEEPTSPDEKWAGPPPPTGQQVAPGVFWDADKEKWLDAQGFELTESAAKVLIKRFTTPTAEDRLLKEQENIRRLQEKGNIFQEQQTALLGAYGSQQTSDVQLQQARFDAYEEARKQILQDATGPADWIVRFAAQNTPNPHRPEKLSDFESLTQSVQQATNKRRQAIKNSQRLFTEEMNALESGNEGLAKELQTKWEASNKAIQHFDKVLFTVNKELAKGPQEIAEFFGAEERQVQTLPNLPNFLAQFTGGGAGQRIDEIGPIRTLSGKQLANLNPTTSGALTGLAEFQGGLSFPDRLAASVAQLPRDVSRGPQTTPFMQRGGIV